MKCSSRTTRMHRVTTLFHPNLTAGISTGTNIPGRYNGRTRRGLWIFINPVGAQLRDHVQQEKLAPSQQPGFSVQPYLAYSSLHSFSECVQCMRRTLSITALYNSPRALSSFIFPGGRECEKALYFYTPCRYCLYLVPKKQMSLTKRQKGR